MTAKNKLVLKFFRNPTSLKYQQIRKVLIIFGFIEINAKGSHKKFVHPLVKNSLIIPVHNNNCKDFYKKLAYEILCDLKQ